MAIRLTTTNNVPTRMTASSASQASTATGATASTGTSGSASTINTLVYTPKSPSTANAAKRPYTTTTPAPTSDVTGLHNGYDATTGTIDVGSYLDEKQKKLDQIFEHIDRFRKNPTEEYLKKLLEMMKEYADFNKFGEEYVAKAEKTSDKIDTTVDKIEKEEDEVGYLIEQAINEMKNNSNKDTFSEIEEDNSDDQEKKGYDQNKVAIQSYNSNSTNNEMLRLLQEILACWQNI